MKLKISEIFPSLQGEGIQIGIPAVFIRAYGCNKRCGSNKPGMPSTCDTLYSLDGQFQEKTPEEVAVIASLFAKRTGAKLVILTGGEPALQDFTLVVKALKAGGLKVAIETNGSIIPTYLNSLDFVSISPKDIDPIKNPYDLTSVLNLLKGSKNHQLKFVIGTITDLQRSIEFLRALKIDRSIPVIFQPNGMVDRNEYLQELDWLWNQVQSPVFASWDIRVIPQVHTMVYGHQRGK